jgi:DNA-damage-inducible protein J
MPAEAVIQTRIDGEIKEKAATVLEAMGLTLSDAVRILLTRTANDGALPFPLHASSQDHDAWFRAQVLEALHDPSPVSTHEELTQRFARRRAEAQSSGKA